MEQSLQKSFLQYVTEKNYGKEEVDLYDENRKYIRTIYRGDTIGQNEWKKCILCFVIDRNGNVLVENKKNLEKDLCSGHIKHNETSTQALLRELYEELGINIDEALQAKHLDNIKISFEETNNNLQCFLDVFCLLRTRDIDLEIDKREIESVEFISYKDFIRKFVNGEIFQYVSEYKVILQKLDEYVRKEIEDATIDEVER